MEEVMPIGKGSAGNLVKDGLTVFGIICVIMLIWHYSKDIIIEGYRNCKSCDDDYRLLDGGLLVSNPFIWPYSAVEDVEKLYVDNKRAGSKSMFGFKNEPLIHLNTPDHIMLM